MDSRDHLGLTEIFRVQFFRNDTEGLFAVLNFRKSKWFFLGPYHPPYQSNQSHYENVDKALHMYGNYQKFLLSGDLK